MLAAEVAILVLGTAYFMIATQNTLTQSLWLCVIPFLPGDAAKLALATLLALALNRRAGLTLV
jgi:biotin transport system substrate-specific component